LSTLSSHARPRQGLHRSHLGRAFAVVLVAGALLLVGGVSPAAAAPPRAVTKTPTLEYGDHGSAVLWVQRKLNVRPSGHFGPRTRAAVKRFQHRHGLHRTGRVGYPTWRALGVRPSSASHVAPRSSSATARSRDAAVLRIAALQKGKPYRYGATGPRAFDCSGFVGYVYGKAGVKLPRTSGAIRVKARRISAAQARPGDLVFVQHHGRVSHVAIYAGHGLWWEASNSSHPVGRNKAWTRSVSYGRI
jgi:cell wall-associated NlpC family hydrolase